ncbi:MAG: hypothetical protein GKR88_06825 [Flavobacteriaceae bacterium]|nr:MAG: hypothetical protein GKR88_06825 [Flavobacteriaceae bacterium]
MNMADDIKKLLRNLFFISREERLYAILKIKKQLETRFLNEDFKIKSNELKLKIKYFIYTRDFSIILNNNMENLIRKIEDVLKKRFAKFLLPGKSFKIKSIHSHGEDKKPFFFSKLEEYHRLLEKVNCILIVQGSYSDGTFVSYSDIDLAIIGPLSKEVPKIKKQIDKELIKIDPLQHHGVFFINSNSFINYWQMDLPIETIEKSLTFSDLDKKINIPHFFNEKFSSRKWLLGFVNTYNDFPITLETDVFFAKYFLSQLMLVPVLVMAKKGRYIHKRDSFLLAKEYYTKEAWKCIDAATLFREKWDQRNIDSNYVLRKDIKATKIKQEYNKFNEVVQINEEILIDTDKSYKLFIQETKVIINS